MAPTMESWAPLHDNDNSFDSMPRHSSIKHDTSAGAGVDVKSQRLRRVRQALEKASSGRQLDLSQQTATRRVSLSGKRGVHGSTGYSELSANDAAPSKPRRRESLPNLLHHQDWQQKRGTKRVVPNKFKQTWEKTRSTINSVFADITFNNRESMSMLEQLASNSHADNSSCNSDHHLIFEDNPEDEEEQEQERERKFKLRRANSSSIDTKPEAALVEAPKVRRTNSLGTNLGPSPKDSCVDSQQESALKEVLKVRRTNSLDTNLIQSPSSSPRASCVDTPAESASGEVPKVRHTNSMGTNLSPSPRDTRKAGAKRTRRVSSSAKMPQSESSSKAHKSKRNSCSADLEVALVADDKAGEKATLSPEDEAKGKLNPPRRKSMRKAPSLEQLGSKGKNTSKTKEKRRTSRRASLTNKEAVVKQVPASKRGSTKETKHSHSDTQEGHTASRRGSRLKQHSLVDAAEQPRKMSSKKTASKAPKNPQTDAQETRKSCSIRRTASKGSKHPPTHPTSKDVQEVSKPTPSRRSATTRSKSQSASNPTTASPSKSQKRSRSKSQRQRPKSRSRSQSRGPNRPTVARSKSVSRRGESRGRSNSRSRSQSRGPNKGTTRRSKSRSVSQGPPRSNLSKSEGKSDSNPGQNSTGQNKAPNRVGKNVSPSIPADLSETVHSLTLSVLANNWAASKGSKRATSTNFGDMDDSQSLALSALVNSKAASKGIKNASSMPICLAELNESLTLSILATLADQATKAKTKAASATEMNDSLSPSMLANSKSASRVTNKAHTQVAPPAKVKDGLEPSSNKAARRGSKKASPAPPASLSDSMPLANSKANDKGNKRVPAPEVIASMEVADVKPTKAEPATVNDDLGLSIGTNIKGTKGRNSLSEFNDSLSLSMLHLKPGAGFEQTQSSMLTGYLENSYITQLQPPSGDDETTTASEFTAASEFTIDSTLAVKRGMKNHKGATDYRREILAPYPTVNASKAA